MPVTPKCDAAKRGATPRRGRILPDAPSGSPGLTTSSSATLAAPRESTLDSPPEHASANSAFTLIELLVVVAIIGILAGLLLIPLIKSKAKAQSIACLNNLKQLQLCWVMYASDHNGELPPNDFVENVGGGAAEGLAPVGLSWCPGNPRVDLTTDNIQQGALYQYNRHPGIYHCPSDRSRVDQSKDDKRSETAQTPLRTRSYNMSGSIGCQLTRSYIPGFYRESDIITPPPVAVFTFIDIHEDSIIDAHFGVEPAVAWLPDSNDWIDMPSDRHNQGANLAFVDGHVEHWKWRAPKIFQHWIQPAANAYDLQDLRRLQAAVRQSFD